MDPASLIISSLSLGLSAAAFRWAHLRKEDSIVCTLVANERKQQSALFQFSFANLGTRSALLRNVEVLIYFQPDFYGTFSMDCALISGQLPQAIKNGEICSVTVESKWTTTFLCQAAKFAESQGKNELSLFFIGQAVAWNPEGKRMYEKCHVATLTANYKDTQSTFEAFQNPFPLKKQTERLADNSKSQRHA
jgi:hypothetical protein